MEKIQTGLLGVIIAAVAALYLTVMPPRGEVATAAAAPASLLPGQYDGQMDTPEGVRYEWLQILYCDHHKCYGRAFVEGHSHGMYDVVYDLINMNTIRGTYTGQHGRTGTVEHVLVDGVILQGILGSSVTRTGEMWQGKSLLKRVSSQRPAKVHEYLSEGR